MPEEHKRVLEARKAVRLATAQLLDHEKEERLERLRELGIIPDKLKKKNKKRKDIHDPQSLNDFLFSMFNQFRRPGMMMYTMYNL